MTLKVVPIQSKMKRPSLSEVVSRLENLFNNYTIRGESKRNVILTSLSYCVYSLQKDLNNDDKMMEMLDTILEQYIDIPEDEHYSFLIKPDND